MPNVRPPGRVPVLEHLDLDTEHPTPGGLVSTPIGV
jgi:hypothetical protein